MAESKTSTSTGVTEQRGTSPADRAIGDRSLDGLEVVPFAKPPVTPKDRTAKKSFVQVANVWAFKIGDYNFNYGPKNPEWTHVFKIESLAELLDELKNEQLHGQIHKLAIVAHGDLGGQVLLEPEINHKNLENFKEQFTLLKNFLRSDGSLIFMACESAAGKEGSFFLAAISSFLSGPYVKGFTIKGTVRARGAPGDVFEGRRTLTGMSGAKGKGSERLTEDSIFAKWARNGKIVRSDLWGELSALMGLWDVSTAIMDDKVVRKYIGAQLTVEEDKLNLAKGKNLFFEGQYKINLLSRPRSIDVTYSSGPFKGKTAAGIFKYGNEDYDSLAICLSGPSGIRPAEFTSAAKSNTILIELTRSANKPTKY
jgi:uncharacterized protein (TIGR03067 family)